MDYRVRGLPPALWRRVRDKAGDRLRDVLLGLLRAYADDLIDPLAEHPVSAALAAQGGRASADALTPEQRRERAQKAAAARWR